MVSVSHLWDRVSAGSQLESWTGLLMSASASVELTFTSCCVSGDNKHINHPAVASRSDRCGRNRAGSGQKTSCVTHQIRPKTKGTTKIRRELVNIWCTATVMQEKLLWILNYIHYQIFQKLLLKYHLYDWLSFFTKVIKYDFHVLDFTLSIIPGRFPVKIYVTEGFQTKTLKQLCVWTVKHLGLWFHFYFIFIQLWSHEDDVKTTKWQSRDSQMNLVKLPNQLRMFSILPVS